MDTDEIKRHVPIAAATLVIAATLVGCTWSIERQIERSRTPSNEWELAAIRTEIAAVNKNTASIDYRMMSPGEKLNFDVLHPQ